MALKVIELDIDDALTGDTRVEEIALVLEPAIETEFMYFSKQDFEVSFDDYPQYITDNAQRAKAWVDENGYGDCLTPVGKARLNQLAKGETISLDTMKRMYSYIARHKKDLESSKEFGDGCGYLAMMSWGEDGSWRTFDWLENKLGQIEEDMGYDVGALKPWSQTTGTSKSDMAEIEGCDCGCSDGTYVIEQDGLYFGQNLIDGMPVFNSAAEAATYAQTLGCNGSHEHVIDGEVYYMPCDVHNPDIIQPTSPEIEKFLEDRGVELEDLLRQGWILEEVNEVDAKKIVSEMAQKFNKIKPEEFYQIITTPGETSAQDLGNKRFRYVYMVGFGAEIIDTSREFCKRMLGGRQFVFRFEDIQALSTALQGEANNMKIIPRPKGTSIDLFQFKGGANCRHYWLQLVFDTGIAGITAEQTDQSKITNNKRKMVEESNYQIPAPNQAGQVNPPVDYGSRSPKSVGLSAEKFRLASSSVIIVDVDDTLVRGNKPIQKTIDYINRKWDTNRIVVVSARPESRTEETKRTLINLGVKFDEIYLSDFPQGPNSGNAFKEYKAKWLKEKGFGIVEAIDNDGEARRKYSGLGIRTTSPTSLKAIPAGFLQGLAIFRDKDDAKEYSEFCGCNGSIEEVDYLDTVMFQSCSYKKQNMSAQFSVDVEKKMIYSPAMKPGILIPRLDEITREKYFVTFKPETIERMAQRFLIEKRTDKTNYEHTDEKFDGVYLVESWIVNGDQDKAYSLGYTKEQIPKGTWMVGYRIDNPEVMKLIKDGKVKGLSIEGNFEYKFSAMNTDEYLLSEIINILNQINQ